MVDFSYLKFFTHYIWRHVIPFELKDVQYFDDVSRQNYLRPVVFPSLTVYRYNSLLNENFFRLIFETQIHIQLYDQYFNSFHIITYY